MSEKGKTDGTSIAALVIFGLIGMLGRTCDSPAPSVPVPSVPTSTLSAPEPVLTSFERSSNGDWTIDPRTASDDAKRAFVFEMLKRQEQANEQTAMEREVQDQLETLKHEVDALKQHADCEQSYRAVEHEYRELGLTLAQVCP